MKWMTLRQIKAAAAKGPLAALDNSIAKYEQMLKAPAGELRKKLERTCRYTLSTYCACCIADMSAGGDSCSTYILGVHWGANCTNSGYHLMDRRADDFIDGGSVTPLRKALRIMISNMKKARKAYVKDNK